MVTIRKATQADRVGIYKVHRSAALELGASHYGAAELEAWVSHLRADLYEQAITTQEVVVAEADGAVVGFGQLNLETGVVEAVYVSPARAGQGVGASLLHTLEQSAHAAGIEQLRLDASLNSVGFYEHMGYRAERAGVHQTRGGREIRCVHMRKGLVP
jgi:N-acetylglutamate synthase-like GNAT family acetyltransferase